MFSGLGDPPGGSFGSLASAISADGQVVVGRGVSAAGFEAFRWDATNGIDRLGDVSGGVASSHALGASSDGARVAGTGTGSGGAEAFVWDATHGTVGLGRRQLVQRRRKSALTLKPVRSSTTSTVPKAARLQVRCTRSLPSVTSSAPTSA